jgi:Protein of unknown function (DUF3592)
MKKKIFLLLISLTLGVSHTYFGLQGGTLQLAKTAFQWLQMQSWQPAQAEIISVGIKKTPSDSSTSILFRIETEYRYRINGEDYSANRVGYNVRQYDNFSDDWHNKQYDRLSSAKSRGNAIAVWVNPRHPQESIVDPSPRWAEIKSRLPALLFLFFGLGSLWLASTIFRTKDIDVFTGDKYEFPIGKPWWREVADWQNSRVPDDTPRARIIVNIIVSIVSSLIFIPISIWLFNHYENFLMSMIIPVLIFLLPIALVWHAIFEAISWVRYGRLNLRMEPFPAQLGSSLRGSMNFPHGKFAGKTYYVEITCEYVDSRGEGSTRTLLWQKKLTVQSRAISDRSSKMEFDVALPADQPESSPPINIAHEWMVKIHCNMPGAQLRREFLIPVFKTT